MPTVVRTPRTVPRFPAPPPPGPTGRHDPHDALVPTAAQRLRPHRRGTGRLPVPPAGRTRPVPGRPPAQPARAGARGRLRPPTTGAPTGALDPVGRRPAARPPSPGADAAQPAGPRRRQRVLGPAPRASAAGRGADRGRPTARPLRRTRGPRRPSRRGDDGPWALVRSAQAGDMSAFSELFDRYYDVVFRYVLFRMNDRTLAEDITQETFLRALRRITSVTYQGRDIGAWFVTIARNLIFDHVKSSRYRLESTTSDIIELSPSTHGPEQQVLDLATNEELLRCVRKLNADQQECISLRFLQGLSVAETAKIMDRNEGAVKALQHRAVRRLAQLLPEGLR